MTGKHKKSFPPKERMDSIEQVWEMPHIQISSFREMKTTQHGLFHPFAMRNP